MALRVANNGCLASKCPKLFTNNMGDVQRLALREGGESLNVKPQVNGGRKIDGSPKDIGLMLMIRHWVYIFCELTNSLNIRGKL